MNSSEIQRAFRHIPGLFLIIRPDDPFTIVGASDDYLKTTGLGPESFGKMLFDVFPDNPADPQASGVRNLSDSLQRVLATGKPDTLVAQRYDVKPAGAGNGEFEERYWNVVNSPVLSEQGAVQYIVHRVEEAAAKANRDAISILESITEGFFTLDRKWRFDYVNQEAHRILDREPGSLYGKVLWAVYPGLEGTEFEANYHRSMFARERTQFTAFYPNHARWYEVTCFPAPEGISVYFRDVTARKKLESDRQTLMAESERQRRIYETALDSTPDFFYVFDTDHRAIYANDALLKTWGVTDVYGKTWLDLGYEQWHADLHNSELDEVMATRAPIRGEVPFNGTGGRRIYDYIFAPVFGAAGEVVAVAGTTRDITERQSAEQAMRDQAARLAESDRSKDEFLATLSHELRNPLAPLRNSLALMRRVIEGDEKLTSVHAMMDRQVSHLVRLVDDLLELSRISRGKLSLRNEKVELAAVVRNAVETCSPLAQSAGHELTVEVPGTPVWLEGDHVRLVQVVANLLDNAVKYTEDGGRLTVRASLESGHAVVRVSDNGVGIAPEALERMFEMFSRGDRDSGRSQGGLGIGLALSRRLAEMHHGTLEARSDGIGKGSEFTVRLPVASFDEGAPAVQAKDDGSLAGTRVLVVDDNRDAGDSLAMVLDMLGAEVRVARGGAEALDIFAGYDASVILLDIGMPGMNGYEVARAVRSKFADRPTVLVALTGWGQDDDRRRAKEAGFDHHLVKPADIDQLEQLLASFQNRGAPA